MTGPWVPPHGATEPEGEFLRRALKGIDKWFDDDTNLDDLAYARELLVGRIAVLDNASGHPDDSAGGDPVVELFGAELHRLVRRQAQVTVLTRGGFRHDRVRVSAVHRHHAVLHHDNDSNGFLLPLTFIESVQQLGRFDSERT